MSDFAVSVVTLGEGSVEKHPMADRLDLVHVAGFVCVEAKRKDGSSKYAPGDRVVYIPEAAIVPNYLLQRLNFWKNEKGALVGERGNRVHALRLRGTYSQGILMPVIDGCVTNSAGESRPVQPGDDVAEFLGITKHRPAIPANLLGEVMDLFGHTHHYDFDTIQKYPDLFTPGEEVVVTEKLHETCCQIGYGTAFNDPAQLFFDGSLYVSPKGLGHTGLVLINNAANDENAYVRIVRRLLGGDGLRSMFGNALKNVCVSHGGQTVRIFGELFGPNVQTGYEYGQTDLAFRLFDVQIGREFIPHEDMERLADELGVVPVPRLYQGPYSPAAIRPFRDGKDSLTGTLIREGVVIKAVNSGYHPLRGRKIAKWISPDYAVTASGDEFN